MVRNYLDFKMKQKSGEHFGRICISISLRLGMA